VRTRSSAALLLSSSASELHTFAVKRFLPNTRMSVASFETAAHVAALSVVFQVADLIATSRSSTRAFSMQAAF
jgi:hypothetical protein